MTTPKLDSDPEFPLRDSLAAPAANHYPMPDTASPLLCALVRGEAPAWPADGGADAAEAFVREARYHGVTPLADARFRERRTEAGVRDDAADAQPRDSASPAWSDTWPDAIRRACREDAVVEAMREQVLRDELARVLDSFAHAGIAALLLKGAALGHSHYAQPALRPRADSDVLVAPSNREATLRVLRALGYRRHSGPAATYVGYQAEMVRSDERGATTSVDLHWRISNAQSFAWLFGFDELAAVSVAVPAIAPSARRLSDLHSLVLALLHRAGNNLFVEPGFGDRLIWLHDVRALVGAMGGDDLARFVRVAAVKRIAAIAIEGLRSTAACFPSPRLDAVIAALESERNARSGAALLRAGRLTREWLELAAIPSMGARFGYLAGRLVPGADYMRERFPDSGSRPLPLLHARRWLGSIVPRR